MRPIDTVEATDPLARLDEVAEALAAETESDGTAGDRFRPPTPVLVIDDITGGSGSQLFGALRDRAVRLVVEVRSEHASEWAAS